MAVSSAKTGEHVTGPRWSPRLKAPSEGLKKNMRCKINKMGFMYVDWMYVDIGCIWNYGCMWILDSSTVICSTSNWNNYPSSLDEIPIQFSNIYSLQTTFVVEWLKIDVKLQDLCLKEDIAPSQ